MLLNRINCLVYLGVVLILSSCAKPIARYTYTVDSEVIPSRIELKNQSEGAESYEWKIDGVHYSNEEAPDIVLYSSGRHTIELAAIKGGKKTVLNQDIIVNAPEFCAVLMRTSLGDMTIELYDETPLHRDNFIKLASSGFYDSLLFHRVINGFMIQGGDPNSKNPNAQNMGTGGPGYKVDAEFKEGLYHYKGSLAAARQGDNVNPKRQSSGSQFYIVQGKPVDGGTLDNLEARNGVTYDEDSRKRYQELGGTPFLDNQYTVFGRVVEGVDVIDNIAGVKTDQRDRPREPVKILQVIPLQ